jgi:hypothetical protein
MSVGRKPSELALNVVIENFSVQTRKTLIEFCKQTRKRVAIVMTEHIDFVDRQIVIHGEPPRSDNGHVYTATLIERLECLMSCQPYIRFFMVLGDLPELRNFGDMMVGADVLAIPFPRLNRKVHNSNGQPELSDDLIFTGFVTEYREKLLLLAASMGLSVVCPGKFVSPEQRDRLNRSAKIVLNIPQRESWQWLSPMRIIAALRCGRATVSLGTKDNSCIAACTYQLDIQRPNWMDELRCHVANWDAAYDKMSDAYCRLANKFEQKHPFPHDMIELWAITDGIKRSETPE